MEKAFRYRFYPTLEQESLLRRTLGCVRLVYNKVLDERTQAWYERQERVGDSETSTMLTQWKKEEELDFLNDVSSVPLQQGLRHLQTAFTNFFAGRTSYPNFKKKRNGRWYISIGTFPLDSMSQRFNLMLVSENSVGIDLGTTSLMATSNGDKIANPKHFNKHRQRLKSPKEYG